MPLVLAVHRQQVGARRRDPDDDILGGRTDPVVVVGQPAGQHTHLPSACQGWEQREGLVERDARVHSPKTSTTAWSMVCFGPVNHLRAETCHQIASTTSEPIVRIGA